MQFKTLAIAAAVVAAAANAQSFDSNPCTTCVFASFDQDTTCKTLPAADLTALKANFLSTSINVPGLSASVQNPAVKACVCHWATTAFTAGGAASSCTSGATPTCNTTQVGQAADGIKGLTPILNCAATPSAGGGSSTTGGSTPAPSTPAAGGKSAGSSIQVNLPYVVSAAVVGLAAFAGF
ncbi:hypothetical protein B0O80DRAFT_439551 [Mortierella sp. GBAus27b]|nr:hypothetical protein BGX31_000754 [Mortierella sp. GBA43]KAI8360540.1 hypothetical protein B0O80DRAFT_439551 [Mortierella sp. GBAus27b]